MEFGKSLAYKISVNFRIPELYKECIYNVLQYYVTIVLVSLDYVYIQLFSSSIKE